MPPTAGWAPSSTIRTPTTSGGAEDQPQSERYSATAVWNSSSRGPCGTSR